MWLVALKDVIRSWFQYGTCINRVHILSRNSWKSMEIYKLVSQSGKRIQNEDKVWKKWKNSLEGSFCTIAK